MIAAKLGKAAYFLITVTYYVRGMPSPGKLGPEADSGLEPGPGMPVGHRRVITCTLQGQGLHPFPPARAPAPRETAKRIRSQRNT